MFRRARNEADRVEPVRLALREIDGNLAFTDGSAWAWFLLPTRPWAFRSDSQREGLIVGAGDAISALAGHRLHLRVTTRPYPAAEWARRLDRSTPQPLPSTGGGSWSDHLVSVQQHLRTQTMAEKEVYLGVRLDSRGTGERMANGLLRRPTRRELAKLEQLASRVAEVVSLPGLEGRPASAAEMEWLVRRSVGLGLPAPGSLSPSDVGRWESEDLHAFTDAVDHAVEPFGRTVRVFGHVDGHSVVERHVAVLSVGRLEEIEVPDPAHEPWLSHTDRLPFPVEWTARLDVLSGVDARQSIQRKLLVVRDMQKHYHEHELDEPLVLDRQARQARYVEDEMTRGADITAARVHGWFRLAVSAPTEEECLERVRRVAASYRGRRVSIEHPRGQYGLMREFVPGEPVSTTAYRRRLPALYFTGGVPTATSQVGDRVGPYVGYTCGASRRAVMFDPHYATEVKETSGLVPVVGGLGAGKSVLLGQIAYEAVRRGIGSV
ncbi:MAG: ATP-binding protein, partial [Thermocrispum sp.]